MHHDITVPVGVDRPTCLLIRESIVLFFAFVSFSFPFLSSGNCCFFLFLILLWLVCLSLGSFKCPYFLFYAHSSTMRMKLIWLFCLGLLLWSPCAQGYMYGVNSPLDCINVDGKKPKLWSSQE